VAGEAVELEALFKPLPCGAEAAMVAACARRAQDEQPNQASSGERLMRTISSRGGSGALPAIVCSLVCSLGAHAADAPLKQVPQSEWIQLFNGRDLTGWTPKIAKHELGENFADTFRVKDGLLQVRYDKYPPQYDEQFGHLFYKTPYSYYRLVVEYRFVGEQAKGGPGAAETTAKSAQ
jgi:hypothetical protein